jgi:hypothetical protein
MDTLGFTDASASMNAFMLTTGGIKECIGINGHITRMSGVEI